MNLQTLQALVKIAGVFNSGALHGDIVHQKLVSKTKRGWRAPTAFNNAMETRTRRLKIATNLGSSSKVRNHYGGVERLNKLRRP